MSTGDEMSVSRAPDAAAVAARRGRLRYYLEGQSTGVGRYLLEQTLFFILQGIPSLVGVGLRALAYRLILQSDGLPVVEDQVRLCQPANIHLGRHVYLDHGVFSVDFPDPHPVFLSFYLVAILFHESLACPSTFRGRLFSVVRT